MHLEDIEIGLLDLIPFIYNLITIMIYIANYQAI